MNEINPRALCRHCGKVYAGHINDRCPDDSGQGFGHVCSEIQDPHKHPLYRPHMGDMTGYRFLEVGEDKNGSEWISKLDTGDVWSNAGHDWPAPVLASDYCAYRRRVTAEPVEQKRYVTAIVPATPENLCLLESCGFEIREGNALSLLDSIEERVVKAIREGV